MSHKIQETLGKLKSKLIGKGKNIKDKESVATPKIRVYGEETRGVPKDELIIKIDNGRRYKKKSF